ncbi:MAG: nitrogen fixation negative regulator NifL [Gammaproteobacteria bacterium]|nr:nitrogen fixation negative regulator NifL [Gammaproteobacteria bacterium]MBU1602783.1 nitrogen fixation negative regulator NifL [Gammaproteobacteria bacterium]MBU2432455.1 nitrogen fixation negative regulator NifL [Gammaproteobacteria bacterium]MBU2449115.1 nitrogen fixation negative regulator NifL [Gammaproteobacteria bacterium]
MSATPHAQASATPAPETALPPEAYRQAVDQADLAISITDARANILFANEAFTRVTGYSKDEIVGKNESTLSNHTTPSELYKAMWSDLSAQKPWAGRLLNKRKDGVLYLAELSISPVVDASGTTTHFVGMHRDITEMHRLERLVRNQKHLIESVVDAAPMAFALLDPTGRVVLDNQEYKKMVSDLRLKEPAHTILDSVLPSWRDNLAERPQECLVNQREARVDRAAGRPRWLSVTSSIIDMHSDCADSYFCADGQPGLLVVMSDITSLRDEQERARASALQAVLAEEERTAAIREGLSAAIFRLEEPMNVMTSAISVLQRRDPASAAMLQQALSGSREHLETLRQVIPQSPHEIVVGVNMNEILRDVLEVSTPRLLSAGITVDWQPASTLPPMLGRPLQLRMLFKALVDNAIEAMNIKGWKRRELSLVSALRDDCIVVSVIDSGPGIPHEWRHKAFEPFFTAKGGSGKHIGTGLSRAQQVVADHGGIIDLDDSPSGGLAAIVEFRVDGDPI